jgi:fluoroquinolone resistance protein
MKDMDNYFEEEEFTHLENETYLFQQGEYEACTFTGCELSEAMLSKSLFSNCSFINCNLSNAIMNGTSIQETEFTNCKLLGLRFDACNLFGFAARFENCLLDHSSFVGMNLKNCYFNKCRLSHVDFSEADLSGISITLCDLADAVFDRTNLQRADFRQSQNFSISPDENQIKGARFSPDQVFRLLNKYQIRID